MVIFSNQATHLLVHSTEYIVEETLNKYKPQNPRIKRKNDNPIYYTELYNKI